MKYKFSVLISLLVFALIGFSFAADTENGPVQWTEGASFIAYHDTAQFAPSTAESNLYSRAIWIGDLWQDSTSIVDGLQLSARCANVAGTEDVNVTLEFCYEKVPADGAFIAGTPSTGLDQVSTTAKSTDYRPDNGQGALWARVKCDGQTSNPTTTYVIWQLYGVKLPGTAVQGVAGAKDYSL